MNDMARCLNCIHFDVCDTDRHEKERLYEDCSDFLNDYDVVPRSEIAMIFEEITGVLSRHYHNNKITLGDRAFMITAKHSARHSIAALLQDIDELKEKYTGDQT